MLYGDNIGPQADNEPLEVSAPNTPELYGSEDTSPHVGTPIPTTEYVELSLGNLDLGHIEAPEDSVTDTPETLIGGAISLPVDTQISSGQHGELRLTNLDLGHIETPGSPYRIIVLLKAQGVSISAHGISTGNETCPDSWVTANFKDPSKGEELTGLFVMGPGQEHVGCRITHNEASLFIYFTAQNTTALSNGISLVNVNRLGDANEIAMLESPVTHINATILAPGDWAVGTSQAPHLAEIRVLGHPSWLDTSRLGKRPASSPERLPQRPCFVADRSVDEAAVSAGIFQPLLCSPTLLNIPIGQAVYIGPGEGGEAYHLTCLGFATDAQGQFLLKAHHSKFKGRVVAVKVLGPARDHGAYVETPAFAEEWLRQTTMLSSLGDHFALVPYLGADARFHAIYTEYSDAQSLEFHAVRYGQSYRRFNGGIQRVWRILSDMAAALAFIHCKGRGAKLTGFGNELSPWYTPVEYLEPFTEPHLADDPEKGWKGGS
ncbi:hypothetical protein ONZ43_g1006 [Nemania bipapillata]|uniref:Uncharacterized protein n=1 Tax=Nemania bipapillata TaxID=110536 RepID=A0ACC2J653_9PEZI|nr:hypothetical protein ONZ43_g1006 [Nemania bipapillata]